MTPSTPKLTGPLLNESKHSSLSTDQTQTSNADNISGNSNSNPPSDRKAGDIKHLFDKVRELKSIDNLDFGDRLELSDIIHEAWQCGFKDRI